MTTSRTVVERLSLVEPQGNLHFIDVWLIEHDPNCVELKVVYVGGRPDVIVDSEVARWIVDYEPPNDFDEGQVTLGRGRIDIQLEFLRGVGLGSLLMRPLFQWIKRRPRVPVCPINLARADVEDETGKVCPRKLAIRNTFYEKLGFKFEYEDEGSYGQSEDGMGSNELVTPGFFLSRGWKVISISGTGPVF